MAKLAGFSVKCGRCGTAFTTANCVKLDHFGIYRVTCPHCQWPGRYLAAELRPVPAAAPSPVPADSATRRKR